MTSDQETTVTEPHTDLTVQRLRELLAAAGPYDWNELAGGGDVPVTRLAAAAIEALPGLLDEIEALRAARPTTNVTYDWSTRIHYTDARPAAAGEPMSPWAAHIAAQGLNMAENATFRAQKRIMLSEVVYREVRHLPGGAMFVGSWEKATDRQVDEAVEADKGHR